jgi:hypothetical protein
MSTATTQTISEDTMAATHGSRIITALEDAWSAIRDHNPEIPAAVVITGSGASQKGTPEGYRLRGHHWPGRWVTGPGRSDRAPELFIAGELLSAGARSVLEVMLHEAAHALAVARDVKDTSAEGNRYHNKRFVRLAEELGLRGPATPDKVTGWADCALTDQTAGAYADVITAIDAARLPYLTDIGFTGETGTTGTGEDNGDGADGADNGPAKRGGRRQAAECACTPPRRLQITPRQLETGPVICGLCRAEFRVPGDDDSDED